MHFKTKICTGNMFCPKRVFLTFFGDLVASAPFTQWGGVGKISFHNEEEAVNKKNRRKIIEYLRVWGSAVVTARLDYAKDEAELKGEV